jgi:methionine synthase I (cobalamin-dependent)
MCDLSVEDAAELAGLELLSLETYHFLIDEGGEELVRECLSDKLCLEEALDNINTCAELYQRSAYFFGVSLEDVRGVLKVIEKVERFSGNECS